MGVQGSSLSSVKMLVPLRDRDFRLLWTGMTASLVGDGVFLLALAWQVYQLSNAPTALSVVGVAVSIPHVLFLLVGGVASDRVDRRRLMIVADLVRAAAMATLGLLATMGALHLWHVMVLAAVYGGATAFFGPAFDAIVPDIVPAELLGAANSLDQFVRPAALRLAGPALGGWLIAAWGTGSAFLVDATTFVISAACVLLMRPAASALTRLERTSEGRTPGATVREIREGFRFVRSRIWLWGTLLAATLAYLLFMGPVEVLLPYVVKNDMGGGAGVLGWVFAMGGVGAIGGAIVVGHSGIPRRFVTFMYISWAVATFAVAGYGLARVPWQAMVASLAFNALETTGTIVWATTKHRLVPGQLLGRVSSFDWFISIGLVPVSFAVTGPVASVLGARATLVWAGLLGGVVTLAALFLPGMRDIERFQELNSESALEEELVPG
jgi:MFS family permease